MATFIVSIPVPVSGDGVAVNVSALVGEKTVTLSGTFKGQYVLLGSHDGNHFDPVLSFDAGGIEGIKQTFSGALKWVRLRSQATDVSGVVANISGLSIPGDNTFGIFPVLMPGASGPQAVSDLGLVNYQGDVNFLAQGGVRGSVVVEGSLDNQEFNPIGSFSAEPASSSLLAAQSFEFSPLATDDRIRYVRLNVKGTILSPFIVTMGGSQATGGGGGPSETLHAAYAVGSSFADQTLNLSDVQGGKVIFDATDPGFTGLETIQVKVVGGEGAAFLSAGGMLLGPFAVQISTPLGTAVAGGYGVAIGSGVSTDGFGVSIGNSCVVSGGGICIGSGLLAQGVSAISLGAESNAVGDRALAISEDANCTGENSMAIGFVSTCFGDNSISIGTSSNVSATLSVGLGASAIVSSALGVAVGAYSLAADNFSLGGTIAIGFNAVADSNSVTVGSYAYCNTGYNNTAVGPGAQNSGQSSVALGMNAVIDVGSTNSLAAGSDSVVMGSYSVAVGLAFVGDSSIGLADYSISIGFSTHTYSENAIAVGPDAVGSGPDSIAIGHEASAGLYAFGSQLAETGCIAIGSSGSAPSGAIANGNYSIAMGSPAFTTGDYNVAVGYYAEAGDFLGTSVSSRNVVMGYIATVGYLGLSVSAAYDDNVVVGSNASSYGASTVAIGSGAQVGAQPTSAILLAGSIAIGSAALVEVDYGIAIGANATSNGQSSIALGQGMEVDGDNSVLIGSDFASVVGDSSVVIGDGASVTSDGSVAIGSGAFTNANYSVAIGSGANTGLTGNQGCIAIGLNAQAASPVEVDNWGIVIGAGSIISGDSNIAIGLDVNVTGTNAVAIGNGAEIIEGGDQNTCVGYLAQVQAGGSWNVCLGNVAQVQNAGLRNVVVGDGAHVLGVSANGCVVIGTGSSGDGDYHVAIGAGVQAVGTWTIAIGTNAVTSGVSAIAIGYGATAADNETVFDQHFGHIQTFRVVSNEPDVVPGTVLDLFQFAESNLTANNTTDLALLIRGSDGSITLKPVYLSVPVGGVSTLLVANP